MRTKWVFVSPLSPRTVLQLKRKQVQLQSKYEGVAPKLVLLTLLAECCVVTLTQNQATLN